MTLIKKMSKVQTIRVRCKKTIQLISRSNHSITSQFELPPTKVLQELTMQLYIMGINANKTEISHTIFEHGSDPHRQSVEPDEPGSIGLIVDVTVLERRNVFPVETVGTYPASYIHRSFVEFESH